MATAGRDQRVRTKVTAALGAVNAELRADEQRLRPKATGDVLDRLVKAMEKHQKLVPAAPMQQAEHLELERSDA